MASTCSRAIFRPSSTTGRQRWKISIGSTMSSFSTSQADPLEMKNLAADGKQHRELVVAMNEKLNGLIDAEVGEDRGQMLPGGIEAGWEVTPETMAP